MAEALENSHVTPDENKALVASFYEAGNRGDMDRCFALISDDIVWTNIGSTRFSGTFRGKQALMEQLLGPLFGGLDGASSRRLSNDRRRRLCRRADSRGRREPVRGGLTTTPIARSSASRMASSRRSGSIWIPRWSLRCSGATPMTDSAGGFLLAFREDLLPCHSVFLSVCWPSASWPACCRQPPGLSHRILSCFRLRGACGAGDRGTFRLRMLSVADVIGDYDAVMSSEAYIQTLWPNSSWPTGLTIEQNLIDLGWHQKEFQRRRSFAYTVTDPSDERILGCVYIYPTRKLGFDAAVYAWTRPPEQTEVVSVDALRAAVRAWLKRSWPFEASVFPGADIGWEEWGEIAEVKR